MASGGGIPLAGAVNGRVMEKVPPVDHPTTTTLLYVGPRGGQVGEGVAHPAERGTDVGQGAFGERHFRAEAVVDADGEEARLIYKEASEGHGVLPTPKSSGCRVDS
jgi:hypothetical protein